MNDDELRPSRTERKRAAEALQESGEKLLVISDADLAALPLPDRLREAVRMARKLSQQRGALRRQRQYIGRLMREMDTGDLEAALAALEQRASQENAVFHAAERWRDRIVAEGMDALGEFFDAHPHAERQRLRQLAQAAQREAATPAARRALYREIRAVLESGL